MASLRSWILRGFLSSPVPAEPRLSWLSNLKLKLSDLKLKLSQSGLRRKELIW